MPFRGKRNRTTETNGRTRAVPGETWVDAQLPARQPPVPERPLALPRAGHACLHSLRHSREGWGGRSGGRDRREDARTRGAADRGAGRQSSAAGPGGQQRRRRRVAAGVAPRGRAGRRRQEGGRGEVTEDGIGGLGVGAGSSDTEGEWRRPLAPGADAATREGAGRARVPGGGAFCLPSPAAPRLLPFPPAT